MRQTLKLAKQFLGNLVVLVSVLLFAGYAGMGCGGCSSTKQTLDAGDSTAGDAQVDGDSQSQAALKILAPQDNQTLNYPADDDDTTAPGLQKNVEVQTQNLDGKTLVLSLDGQQVAQQLVTETNGQGTVTFSAVTLPHRPNGLVIKVESSDGLFSDSVTVKVDLGNLCTVALEPTNNVCLTEDADGAKVGFQLKFVVKNDNGCDKAKLQYTIAGGTQQETTEVEFTNGQAEVMIDVTSDATPVDGSEIKVVAVVSDSTSSGRVNSSAETTYKADSEDPTVTLTDPGLPNKTLAKANDTNNDKDGIQFSFSGTVIGVDDTDADSVVMLVREKGQQNFVEAAKTTPTAQGTYKFNEVTFEKSGTFELVVRANDGCRTKDSATFELSVVLETASIAIVAPADKFTFLAKDDGDPKTTHRYETEITVQVDVDPTGQQLQIVCNPSNGPADVPVGTLSVTAKSGNGLYKVPVKLIPGQDQNCKAKLIAPNPATSEAKTYSVGLPNPVLGFSSPIDGGYLTSTTVNAVLFAKYLKDAEASVTIKDKDGVVVATKTLGSKLGERGLQASFEMSNDQSQLLADGQYTVEIDASDKYGNKASDNAANTLRSIAVMLDTSAPVVSINSPAATTLSTDADGQTPGFQSEVVVGVSGADSGGGTQLCVVLNANKPQCKTLSNGDVSATFMMTWRIGENALEAYALDKAGNKATPVAKTISVTPSDANVRYAVQLREADGTPLNDIAVFALPYTIKVKVTDTGAGNGDVDAASLSVFLNGTDVTSSLVSKTDTNASGEAEFKINLSAGDNTIVVTATKGNASGTSDARVLRYIDGAPAVTTDNLTDNDTLSLSSNVCLAGVQNCLATVSATAVNLLDGVSATVTATCGGDLSAVTSTIVGGKLTFNGLSLTDGKSCSVSIVVKELDGSTVYTMPALTVTVDRTPPKVDKFTLPSAFFLAFDGDADPLTNGLQAALRLNVRGAEKDQPVTVVVSNAESLAEIAKLTKALSVDASDTTPVEVTMPTQTFPDGYVELMASLSDKAGNATEPFVIYVRVVSEVPSVVLFSPISPKAKFGAGVREVGIRAINFDAGEAIRVCSDGPGVSGQSCSNQNAKFGTFKLSSTTAVTQEVMFLDVSALADGKHNVTVEIFHTPTQQWISALAALDSASPTDDDGAARELDIKTTLPLVSAFDTTSHQGGDDAYLNIVEQEPNTVRNYKFEVTCDLTGDETGTLEILVNSVPALLSPLTVTKTECSNGITKVIQLPESPTTALNIVARITDGHGNVVDKSAPPLKVDTRPPLFSFLLPSSATVLMGNSTNVQLISLPDASIDPTVNFELKDGATTLATAKFVGNQILFSAVLDNKPLNNDALVAHNLSVTVVDLAKNAATFPAVGTFDVTVDIYAPEITLISVKDKQGQVKTTFVDADDNDSNRSGIQLNLSVSAQATSGKNDNKPQSYSVHVEFNCINGTCGDAEPQAERQPFPQNGVLDLANINFPASTSSEYKVRVEVFDQLNGEGNKAIQTHAVTVTSTQCQIAFTNLSPSKKYFNKTDAGQSNQVTLSTSTANCGALTNLETVVRYKDTTNNDAEVVVGAQDGIGPHNFTLNLVDGTVYKDLEAVLRDKSTPATPTATTTPRTLTADLTDPQVTLDASTYDTAARTGIKTPEVNTPTCDPDNPANNVNCYIADDDQDQNPSNGLQIRLVVTVTDQTSLKGGRLETDAPDNATVLKSFSSLQPTDTTKQYTIDGFRLNKDAAGANTYTLTVFDAAGNSKAISFKAKSDHLRPDTPTLQVLSLVRRYPQVKFSWPRVSDDGLQLLAASRYEFRFAFAALTNGDWADNNKSCRLADVTKYKPLPNNGLPTPGDPSAQPPANVDTFDFEGPDLRQLPAALGDGSFCKYMAQMHLKSGAAPRQFHFALRAQDGTGNWSNWATVGPVDLSWRYLKVAFSGSPSAEWGARVHPVGDLDNDGIADVAFGGNTGINGNCILYGKSFESITNNLVTIDVTSLSNDASGDNFRYVCLTGLTDFVNTNAGIFTRGVGDVNGDGVDDLAITGNTEVYVFFGRKGQLLNTTPDLIVRGVKSNTSNVTVDGANVVDVRTVDVTVQPSDLIIGSYGDDRVYVVPGSTSWKVGNPKLIIDVSDANVDDPTGRKANRVVTYRMVEDAHARKCANDTNLTCSTDADCVSVGGACISMEKLPPLATTQFGKYAAAVGPILDAEGVDSQTLPANGPGLKNLLAGRADVSSSSYVPELVLIPGREVSSATNVDNLFFVSEFKPDTFPPTPATDNLDQRLMRLQADSNGLHPNEGDELRIEAGSSFNLNASTQNTVRDLVFYNFSGPRTASKKSVYIVFGEWLKEHAKTNMGAVVQLEADNSAWPQGYSGTSLLSWDTTLEMLRGVVLADDKVTQPVFLDYTAKSISGLSYEMVFPPADLQTWQYVYFRRNMAAEGKLELGSFPYLEYNEVVNPTDAASTKWGRRMLSPLTDFNGDGFPDVVVGNAGATPAPYAIILY